MFIVPYRWLPRTIWTNIDSCWWDFRHGIHNLWRWLPVIWFDHDFDWAFTGLILEIKLRRLADCMENGYHLNGARDAKQARTCAALLKRLRDDDYFDNAGYDQQTWKSKPDHEQRRIA